MGSICRTPKLNFWGVRIDNQDTHSGCDAVNWFRDATSEEGEGKKRDREEGKKGEDRKERIKKGNG